MSVVADLKAAMERAKLLMTLEQEKETSAAVQSFQVARPDYIVGWTNGSTRNHQVE